MLGISIPNVAEAFSPIPSAFTDVLNGNCSNLPIIPIVTMHGLKGLTEKR